MAAILSIALCAGCKKSAESTPTESASQPPSANGHAVARLHWLGLDHLATRRDAALFNSIWRLPESTNLEANTLDKLALSLTGNEALMASNLIHWPSNPPSLLVSQSPAASLLRPLLDDLPRAESYTEIVQAPGQSSEVALAIHLNDQRASLWQSNLAAVLESLTGVRPAPLSAGAVGWSVQLTNRPGQFGFPPLSCLELRRAGAWTILDAASRSPAALAADFAARIRRDHVPFPQPAGDAWVDAAFDVPALVNLFVPGWNPPVDLPRVSLTLTGDGSNNVLTTATLNFPKPLPFSVEPWDIPTNIIRGPLHSFTAIQGVAPYISALAGWTNLGAGPPPNQLYCFAQQPMPVFVYCVAPLADASNSVTTITNLLLQHGDEWLTNHARGKFEPSLNAHGVDCTAGSPMARAFIESQPGGRGGYAVVGFARNSMTAPMAPELIQELRGRTNLVYFDGEITGPEIRHWIYDGQFLRVMCWKAQLPERPGVPWLVALETRLGPSTTRVTMTSPTQLAFSRVSAIGLTGIELNLLTDWLESPTFPCGINTFAAPEMARPRHRPPHVATPSH